MIRRTILSATLLALTVLTSCGSSGTTATTTRRVADTPTTPAGPLLLAEFDNGVGAVVTESSTPVWLAPNAVAALDGSAVFSIHPGESGSDELARLDPATGTVSSRWPVRDGLTIGAVSPGGRWIALTDRRPGYGDQGRASTDLVVFDTTSGATTFRLALTGDVQPEAFSVDGRLVFALDYRGDHYRVQTIELRSGERYDTSDRDKQPPEDMHGQAVHGVMSANRTLLATLYRNPGDDDEPAFVHVLDLVHGWSYCADLPAPFGTGAPGTDAIELQPTGTVLVAVSNLPRVAEIHIDDVSKPPTTQAVRVSYRAGTIAPTSAALQAMPGLQYVIAPISI